VADGQRENGCGSGTDVVIGLRLRDRFVRDGTLGGWSGCEAWWGWKRWW
jgi:hypothetical protein